MELELNLEEIVSDSEADETGTVLNFKASKLPCCNKNNDIVTNGGQQISTFEARQYTPRTHRPFQWTRSSANLNGSSSINPDLEYTLGDFTRLRSLGSYYFYQKDYEKALLYFEQGLHLSGEEGLLNYRDVSESYTVALIMLGRYKEAKTVLKKVCSLEGNSSDVTTYYNLGEIYLKLRKFGESATALYRCLDVHPEIPIYWLKLAELALGCSIEMLLSRGDSGAKVIPRNDNNVDDTLQPAALCTKRIGRFPSCCEALKSSFKIFRSLMIKKKLLSNDNESVPSESPNKKSTFDDKFVVCGDKISRLQTSVVQLWVRIHGKGSNSERSMDNNTNTAQLCWLESECHKCTLDSRECQGLDTSFKCLMSSVLPFLVFVSCMLRVNTTLKCDFLNARDTFIYTTEKKIDSVNDVFRDLFQNDWVTNYISCCQTLIDGLMERGENLCLGNDCLHVHFIKKWFLYNKMNIVDCEN